MREYDGFDDVDGDDYDDDDADDYEDDDEDDDNPQQQNTHVIVHRPFQFIGNKN